MAVRSSLWYRLGFLLEQGLSSPRSVLSAVSKGALDAKKASARTPGAADALKTLGPGALAGRLLALWPARERPGVARLLRAAAAGAGAAAVIDVLSPLLRGELRLEAVDDATLRRAVRGAVRGLVYGAVVDPRLPGPALVRGATFGAADYLAAPLGGVDKVLGSSAPHRRIPGLSALVADLTADDEHDEELVDALAFGLVLALLYGEGDAPPSSHDAPDADG